MSRRKYPDVLLAKNTTAGLGGVIMAGVTFGYIAMQVVSCGLDAILNQIAYDVHEKLRPMEMRETGVTILIVDDLNIATSYSHFSG